MTWYGHSNKHKNKLMDLERFFCLKSIKSTNQFTNLLRSQTEIYIIDTTWKLEMDCNLMDPSNSEIHILDKVNWIAPGKQNDFIYFYIHAPKSLKQHLCCAGRAQQHTDTNGTCTYSRWYTHTLKLHKRECVRERANYSHPHSGAHIILWMRIHFTL